jgi:hypothetical protein
MFAPLLLLVGDNAVTLKNGAYHTRFLEHAQASRK